MEPFRLSAESSNLLHLQMWEERNPSLVAGFTMRHGGNSGTPFHSANQGLHVGDEQANVIRNRREVCEQLGFPFESWTCADQIHGNRVVRVAADLRGAGRESLQDVIAGTDGLHTNEPGILLTSFYADCVPLFFLDPTNKAIGLAHAGWKGTVARISEEMLNAFSHHYGSRREDILVAIGPSIGGCCYEVDDRIIDRVRAATSDWQASVTAKENGKYMLDLPRLNESILLDLGVPSIHIARTTFCTGCHMDLFFSYRKEGGKTGRMASFIGWKGDHNK